MNRSSPQSDVSLRTVSPLHEVWSLAWPTVLTMTSFTVMQFVDSLMVAQVGPLELAAQGNGGIWAFTPLAFTMGMLSVVNTFVSQNLGAGRPRAGAQYAWAAIWLSVALWLVIMLPYGAVLPLLFAMAGHSEQLQQYETHYAQILIAGSVIIMISRGLHHYFFGLHLPKIVTISAISGNTVNIIANYVLIFGSEGLPMLGLPGVPGVPALGIYGAALGTVTGAVVEMSIPATIFLSKPMHERYGTRTGWRVTFKPIRDLLRIGWPASMQFGNEILCWAIFMSLLVGRFGEDHMAAGWAALRYMHLSFMPAVGFSVAATSLVGRYIGARQPDTALARARLAVGLSVAYMTLCAIIFVVFRHELMGLFVSAQDIPLEQANEIVRIGGVLLICVAVIQAIDAVGIVYMGALRGAGDTIWPGLVTVCYSWCFAVLGGWLMTELVPELKSLGPWMGFAAYLVAFGITMSLRFESGRWRRIRLLWDEDAATSRTGRTSPMSPGPPAATADSSVRDFASEVPIAFEDARRESEDDHMKRE